MYDRNDRSPGRGDGNVNGAMKEGSQGDGVDSPMSERQTAPNPVRRLASLARPCAGLEGGRTLPGAGQLHCPGLGILRTRIPGSVPGHVVHVDTNLR